MFLIVGGLWMLVGLTAMMPHATLSRRPFLGPLSADTALFVFAAEEPQVPNRQLATLRLVTIPAYTGFMTAAGLLIMATSWFGWKETGVWPLALLTVVGMAVLPYWWIAFGPHRQAGVTPGLFDLPSFLWIPGILMPLGSLLGWFAYLRGG
jgi:hypothetical protein